MYFTLRFIGVRCLSMNMHFARLLPNFDSYCDLKSNVKSVIGSVSEAETAKCKRRRGETLEEVMKAIP